MTAYFLGPDLRSSRNECSELHPLVLNRFTLILSRTMKIDDCLGYVDEILVQTKFSGLRQFLSKQKSRSRPFLYKLRRNFRNQRMFQTEFGGIRHFLFKQTYLFDKK